MSLPRCLAAHHNAHRVLARALRRPRRCHVTASALQPLPEPLVERPGRHVCSAAALRTLLCSLEAQAVAAAPNLAGRDAPTLDDLRQELRWLEEDCVSDVRAHRGAPWQPATRGALAAVAERATARSEVRTRASSHELRELWRRRLQERVPYQYLVAGAHWRDMLLAVAPGALIPRPETELLIDIASDALSARPALADSPWIDLGCGSGAISLALARLLAKRTAAAPSVIAVDISDAAAALTRHNAARLGLSDAVAVRQGSWGAPCGDVVGQAGGVVSNPPYIPKEDLPALQAEVGWHEPLGALAGGGSGGMLAPVEVVAAARRLLRPGGFLALETNAGAQAAEIERVVRTLRSSEGPTAFVNVRVLKDFHGRDRFVVADRWR